MTRKICVIVLLTLCYCCRWMKKEIVMFNKTINCLSQSKKKSLWTYAIEKKTRRLSCSIDNRIKKNLVNLSIGDELTDWKCLEAKRTKKNSNGQSYWFVCCSLLLREINIQSNGSQRYLVSFDAHSSSLQWIFLCNLLNNGDTRERERGKGKGKKRNSRGLAIGVVVVVIIHH